MIQILTQIQNNFREIARPNTGFMFQLLLWQKELKIPKDDSEEANAAEAKQAIKPEPKLMKAKCHHEKDARILLYAQEHRGVRTLELDPRFSYVVSAANKLIVYHGPESLIVDQVNELVLKTQKQYTKYFGRTPEIQNLGSRDPSTMYKFHLYPDNSTIMGNGGRAMGNGTTNGNGGGGGANGRVSGGELGATIDVDDLIPPGTARGSNVAPREFNNEDFETIKVHFGRGGGDGGGSPTTPRGGGAVSGGAGGTPPGGSTPAKTLTKAHLYKCPEYEEDYGLYDYDDLEAENAMILHVGGGYVVRRFSRVAVGGIMGISWGTWRRRIV